MRLVAAVINVTLTYYLIRTAVNHGCQDAERAKREGRC